MKPHILYEDQDIIVCLKPAGIPTQTSRPGLPDMVSILKNHIYQNSAHKKQPYLAVIHRLDQPVEGLLVFAKTPAAAKELNRQLQSFGFGKYYQAVLLGCPQTADGILEDYLVKDGRTNTSRICTEETPGAKVARLSYHIAKTTAEFSLAEIHLDTGRHHQIRVQMAHLGCPIAGDRKYGPNQTSFSQLQLFACRLEFAHPKTKKAHGIYPCACFACFCRRNTSRSSCRIIVFPLGMRVLPSLLTMTMSTPAFWSSSFTGLSRHL